MSLKSTNEYLQMLNDAKSDTEKFASLLIVAKLIHSDSCGPEIRKKLFEAVGFKFLSRLLKTEKIDDGCSRWTYKGLAVTILSCFCSDASQVVQPGMLANLRDFNDIIISISESSEDKEEQNIITDTYDCLTCIASQPAGVEALVQQQTVTALCQAVAKKCYGWQKAQQLILYMVNINGSETWNGNIQGLHLVLQYFVQLFKANQDESKFGVCSTIYIILSSVQKEQLQQITDQQWCLDMQETVFFVLQNKLGSHHRESVLKLACIAVDLLGVEWTLNKEDTQKKFLLLLVHLCCIEIRICLESGSPEKIESKAEILCSSYLLLENVISYMTTETSLLLDDKQVRQLHSAMLGAFNAVLQFLNNIQTFPEDKQENNFTVATVRVLGSWIAEETSALQEQVINLIPFLLKLSKKAYEQNTTSPDQAESSKEQSMDTDVEPMEDVLKFLLPGLCHLSSEEKARQVFLAEKGHELLGQYFSKQYSVLLSPHGQINTEAQVALTTLCGVFLNLVVMEPDLVSMDTVFSELLSFLITTLPSLVEGDRNLILAFNMCVLCLMLLRHYSKNLQVSTSDCDKFYKSTICLLWCHDYTEHNSQGNLVLKEKHQQIWSEINELWFLGMQAFNACVPLFPNIPSAVLRSGWIASILKTFNKIEAKDVDDITRQSYSSLLLQLALQGGDIKHVIQEKGGVQFSQMYEFPSLAECLRK